MEDLSIYINRNSVQTQGFYQENDIVNALFNNDNQAKSEGKFKLIFEYQGPMQVEKIVLQQKGDGQKINLTIYPNEKDLMLDQSEHLGQTLTFDKDIQSIKLDGYYFNKINQLTIFAQAENSIEIDNIQFYGCIYGSNPHPKPGSDTAVSATPYFRLREGKKMEEFKEEMNKCFAIMEKEKGMLQFGFTYSDDGKTAFVRQQYVDADAVNFHLVNCGPIIGKVALDPKTACAEFVRIEIHGPKAEVDKLRDNPIFKTQNMQWYYLEPNQALRK